MTKNNLQDEPSKLTCPCPQHQTVTEVSNQWNLLQCILFSLSFEYFNRPTLLRNSARHQKLNISDQIAVWKMLEWPTRKWLKSVKFRSWNEPRRLTRPPWKTTHGIKCSVSMKINSQMVNNHIKWNSWGKKKKPQKTSKWL